jgi:16S rRNA (guanine(966)-N(2))-methyltransferase RsmD
MAMNRIRIVGGAWRSRVLQVPDALGLRPTPDRVRETLFNWLGQDLTGMRCLDLCAGTGALGFEALSRGAAHVDMVESAREVHAMLRRAGETLQAGTRLRLVRADALEFLRASKERYDIVFLDPPYQSGLLDRLLPQLPEHLEAGARVYVESGAPQAWLAPWEVLKSGRAGAVHYYLLHLGRA